MREVISSDTLDLIYQAALDLTLWPDVLTRLAQAFGAPCATVIPLSQSFSLLASPGLEDAQRAYADGWWTFDTMIKDMQRKSFPVGLYNDWEQLPARTFTSDSYYQDFRAKFGMGHVMSSVSKPYRDEAFEVGLQLAAGREPPGSSEVETFRVLAQHLDRSLAISVRTSSSNERTLGMEDLLSALPHGAAIVDRHGQVLMVNAAMSVLDGDGLRLSTAGLRCARFVDQAALDRLIAGCLSASVTAEGPDQIAIARPSGRRPLIVRAIPLRRRPDDRPGLRFGAGGAVLVLVLDPDDLAPNRPEHALRLLGLTKAEARVAALIGTGLSAADTGEALKLAQDTVRAHLKAIYQKLDLRRQSELAVLVTRLSASCQGPA